MNAPVYSCQGMPTVERFFDSNAFIRGLMGPLGSGKSSACVWEIAQRGVMQAPGLDGVRRSRWVVIRNTYKELEDTTEKTFLQWFPPHIHGSWVPSRHQYIIRSLKASLREPTAEIEVLFRALDRPDQVKSLLSLELTGGWINEAREVPWAIVDGLSGRVGRFPAKNQNGGATWAGIFMDTNPPDTESEWYRFFEDRKGHAEAVEALAEVIPGMTLDKFSAVFKQPSGLSKRAENLGNLPVGYYQRLAVGKGEDWIKVHIRGEYGFSVDGKAVFPEYYDETHCPSDSKRQPRLIPSLEVIRSWDFGLTPAVVFSQVDAHGRWNILDELVATSMGADKFSDEVLDYSNLHYRDCSFVDVGDPAGMQRSQADEKTCFQILHGKGIMIQPAPQTLMLRLEGTRRPMRMMVEGRPQFCLHERCKVLRRAMLGGYHYRRMRVSGEQYTSQPAKNSFSHVADACTYAGAWLFGNQVRGISAPLEDEPVSYGPRSAIADRSRSPITGY